MLVVQVYGSVEEVCEGLGVGAGVIWCGLLVVESSQHPQKKPGSRHFEAEAVDDVIGCPLPVGVSQQPQITPGVSHVEVVVRGIEQDVGVVELIGSRQPNRPGFLHVDVAVVQVGIADVGPGVGVEVVVVVGSLQPNQPGVLHVEVDVPVAEDVEVVVVVVVSSRQPHHPGVLQVDVLVEVGDVVVVVAVVVISEPLLRKNFQSWQSKHSSSRSQVGSLSYSSITSLITDLMRCVPIATRQPLSSTVSYVHS